MRNIREKYLMDRYEQMMKSWTKKMERIENSTRRRCDGVLCENCLF